ncbi:hypothetical protein GUITHDRAFT_166030 [Guillardia theta CCMP2712]|uniref:Transcription factor TFIIIB component B'' Myb domain-containing protein n=1 Tax=Guillardia theta (strain CCMP2712) TaxID=905079 RepID=L1IGW2_GUITC|nr:hypothetical protein GUITHDRAFT_166030 [Guillardia theta CCMP2712]EKX35297.1 hypothetical protein GUITHDRAFT_166030 [Guillardia theta CCMP2712]|eukprot:XP_005822277.1 hypothetical protein GUITHDRAFT_166030 [Guillardia theta CCMP2712]
MEQPKRAHPRGRVKPNLALLGKKVFVTPTDKSSQNETAADESPLPENSNEGEQNVSLPISCNTECTQASSPKSVQESVNGEKGDLHQSPDPKESDVHSARSTQTADAPSGAGNAQQQVSERSGSQVHSDGAENAASSGMVFASNGANDAQGGSEAESSATSQAKRAHPRGRVAPKIGSKVFSAPSASKAAEPPESPTRAETSETQLEVVILLRIHRPTPTANEESAPAADHGEPEVSSSPAAQVEAGSNQSEPFQKCSSQMRNLLKTLKNQERKSLAQINNYRQRMKANQLLKALKEIRLQQQEKKKQSRQQEGEIQLSHRDKQLRHQLHETRLERGRNSPLNWTPWLPQDVCIGGNDEDKAGSKEKSKLNGSWRCSQLACIGTSRKKKSNKKKAAAESHNGDGDTQNDSTTGNEGASVNGKAAEGGAGKKRKASAKGKGVSSESNDPNAEPASAVQPQSPTADSTSGSTSKNVNGGRKSEKPRNSRPPSTPEKSVEQRTIRELMRDPSYGMPMSAEGQARAEKRRKRTGEPNQPTSFENDAPESQVDNSSVMAPQVRTVGGRIVIDDSSLTISNATESNLDMSDIVLDQSGRGTNAWSKKRKHCDRWTAEETERFYVGLRKFGLDFQLIASWMGDRRNDRRHVRNKFKKEERLNLARINQAIANRMPVNDEDWRKVKGLGPETLGQNSKIPAQTPGAEEAAGLPGTPNAMEHESGSDLPEDDANESDDY